MSPPDVTFPNVIPRPVESTRENGTFALRRTTPVVLAPNVAADTAARLLHRELGLNVVDDPTGVMPGAIRCVRSTNDLGPEAYALTVRPDGVVLSASSPAGWFYAAQSLIALVQSNTTEPAESCDVQCVTIGDRPCFAWRGLMLDVSRHLMPVDGILRLIDAMAAHKLNTFHWHLTDDHGWRIESRRFPRLTGIGAWRRGGDGTLTPGGPGVSVDPVPRVGRYGGFYTHDDVRRVVAHAAERHVRVVPEIEMPGHALAALAAYPHLACTEGTFEPATLTGVFDDVYCAGNDATFDLLEGVLDEILPLFPGEYVHVGGDECPKTRWKACPKCQARIHDRGLADEHALQGYVIERIARFLEARGKRLVGWDEILESDLPASATVMCWRATDHARTAVDRGHDVVMTPKTFSYFDYRQAPEGEPYAIGDVTIRLPDVYAAEPVPAGFTPEQATRVVGVQANVWTEYMPDIGHVEYMVWPRAAALAEVAWSPAAGRDWADFHRRVLRNEHRLARLGSRFRPDTTAGEI